MSRPAFDWTSAWEEIEDDPDFTGVHYYELPTGGIIYEGDKFWDTDCRFLVEVVAVKTQKHKGVIGPKGESGGDYVFFEKDTYSPSGHPHLHYDANPRMSVQEFADHLASGELVAHTNNGLPRRPP